MNLKPFAVLALVSTCPVLQAETLDAQLIQAQQAIEAWRQQKRNGLVKLVLGATSQEKERFEAANPNSLWVYLDAREHTSLTEPHLQVDFNKLEDLQKVAVALKGQINLVTFDRGTVYFTEWGELHLRCIEALLTPGGSFFLPAEMNQNKDENQPVFKRTANEDADAAQLAASSCKAGMLPTFLNVPSNWGVLPASLQAKVRLERRKNAQALLEKVFARVEVRNFMPLHLAAHYAKHYTTELDFFVCSNLKAGS